MKNAHKQLTFLSFPSFSPPRVRSCPSPALPSLTAVLLAPSSFFSSIFSDNFVATFTLQINSYEVFTLGELLWAKRVQAGLPSPPPSLSS